MLKTLPVNETGRDFVVGDLHGCFDLLEAALLHVNFDKTQDRLISVGDLVDRGPKNLECLELLWEPWFHAVQGNHEDLMLSFFDRSSMGRYWPQNGGMWHQGFSADEQLRLKDLLGIVDELPFVITVLMKDHRKFHVLHAEMDSDGDIVDDEIMADEIRLDPFINFNSWDGPSVIWSRTLFRGLFGKEVNQHLAAKHRRGVNLEKADLHFGKDLSTIFSGHTVMQQPTKIGPQINIDTGAVFSDKYTWAGLTLAEPLTGRFWKARPEGVTETFMVEV